jgi:hypothetical protein
MGFVAEILAVAICALMAPDPAKLENGGANLAPRLY